MIYIAKALTGLMELIILRELSSQYGLSMFISQDWFYIHKLIYMFSFIFLEDIPHLNTEIIL